MVAGEVGFHYLPIFIHGLAGIKFLSNLLLIQCAVVVEGRRLALQVACVHAATKWRHIVKMSTRFSKC